MTPKGLRRGLATAGAVLLGLAAATGSWAQGMYYKEIVKDGRVYVFNDAKGADAFEKSGEVGKAITRVGIGPNGETVVADSETALELYFFKHGIAETVEKPKKPKMEISWKDGKTTIATDKAEMQISNRVQVRWTEQLPDDSVQLAGTENEGDSKGSFRIRRAKLKFEGWIYKKELSYEVQLNWPDANGTPVARFMEEAQLNWDISRNRLFMVKFGQFKVPFGRQELTSSGSQQFVDRSDVSNRYARGRETGIQIWGEFLNKKAEWRAGAFNGNGRSQDANDNDKYQYNARLQFHPNGDPKYSESDFESKDKVLWSLAVDFESNDKSLSTTNVDTNDLSYGFDGVFKYKGFSAVGEYFDKRAKSQAPATGPAPPTFHDKGWYAQAAYLFDKGRHWELAFRYGKIDPSDKKDGDDRKEIGGAVNYYYNKHNLKVQADFRQLEDEAANSGSGARNKEFRLQTQFVF